MQHADISIKLRGTMLKIFLASAIVAGIGGPWSMAQTQATWTGGVSTSWIDPGNWSTAPFYPTNDSPSGSTYEVTIAGSGTTSVLIPDSSWIVLNRLSLSGAALSLGNNVRVDLLQSGTINGSFNLSAATGKVSRLSMPGGVTLNGTGTISTASVGTGSVFFESGGGTVTLGPGLTFALNAGSCTMFSSPFVRLLNSSTLIVTNGTTRIRSGTFQNSGTVNVLSGTLALQSYLNAASLGNFLWTTFTRSNPAADTYGIDAFVAALLGAEIPAARIADCPQVLVTRLKNSE